jgi:DNA-binding LacI/PurR family transcriptional regulator
MSTQKELAKYAGVSAGTVSNVISGSTQVSERSRQKVEEAIRALNYRPNLIARSLKTNRTNTLGIVVPDITIPFFPKIIRGAESAARERGYFLMVLDSENNHSRELEMIALLHAQRVDGLLLIAAGGQKWSSETFAVLTSGTPVVCVDRLPKGLQVDSVGVDDRSAAELGVSHLLAMGHKQIAVLTGPLNLENERERLRGYRHAMRSAGLPVQESLIWTGGFDRREIAQVCQRGLLKPKGRPTALFATNGVTGLDAVRCIYESGLSIPQNISFVTLDDFMTEDLFQPSITSVVQPAFDIGYGAVKVLLDRIAKGKDQGSYEHIRLPATLVVRDSSKTLHLAEPGKTQPQQLVSRSQLSA